MHRPVELMQLLSNDKISFIGHNVVGDRTRLVNDYCCPSILPNLRDTLREAMHLRDELGLATVGLDNLVNVLLHKRFSNKGMLRKIELCLSLS